MRSIANDLHMDYTAVGQTTHLAARMEQLASPGTILTANTLRLAEGYVQVKPLGAMPVKGLPAPVEAYELTGAGPGARGSAATARGSPASWAGRASWSNSGRRSTRRQRAHGHVVALIGEPGVGKSRLVWEFTHSHRTLGWLVLQAGSVSYGKATPYLPVIELLKGYCQIEDRDDHRRDPRESHRQAADPRSTPSADPARALLRSWTCRSRTRNGTASIHPSDGSVPWMPSSASSSARARSSRCS